MIKVDRSQQIPQSLVNSTAAERYRSDDVVDQLAKDFREKCYICEIKRVTDPVVEHRLPHKGGKYPDRKYDWNNLFYSCNYCNLVKNKGKYDNGIIDCCVRDPEGVFDQELVEDSVLVSVKDRSDDEAMLTAELLHEVFMSDSPALRKRGASARLQELQHQMNMLYSMLEEYRSTGSDYAVKTLGAMLSREAAFAGFTRCYVRKHLDTYPELEIYLK